MTLFNFRSELSYLFFEITKKRFYPVLKLRLRSNMSECINLMRNDVIVHQVRFQHAVSKGKLQLSAKG